MGTEKKKIAQNLQNAEEKAILTKLPGFNIFTQKIFWMGPRYITKWSGITPRGTGVSLGKKVSFYVG